MSVSKNIVCIQCPMGCQMKVELAGAAPSVRSVEGNGCARGKLYAEYEAVDPKRTVTGTVCVLGALEPLSFKTSSPVPKAMVSSVVSVARGLHLKVPVRAGEVICTEVCGTSVNLVATKTVL